MYAVCPWGTESGPLKSNVMSEKLSSQCALDHATIAISRIGSA
jgi:hypothetical protein